MELSKKKLRPVLVIITGHKNNTQKGSVLIEEIQRNFNVNALHGHLSLLLRRGCRGELSGYGGKYVGGGYAVWCDYNLPELYL